ncbi:aldolase catalytic domain-containing protein [Candidatus Pelagibacter bacterium nBUS_27]|uniref:aldolase catalytic domain-containing protein n=1 Tax=Candidatus Pelagibacter bacterium nBUS_27 TaxID=3374188 RepID=UPI003EBC6D9E
MKINKINLLDCTLRDGGYYNNWFFEKELINEYLKVMDMIKIEYVEIGFRFLDKVKIKGPCAYSKESFLKSLKIPKNLKIGIMVNASDFIGQKNLIDLAKKNFKPKKDTIISLIRIACYHHELKEVLPLIKWLKKSGYKVGVNIMQIPELSFNEIKNAVKEVRKANPDVLYFADSMGSLDAAKTKKIIYQIKSLWKKSTGIHTHDNMGKALENSITAIYNNVNWIDCTVTGMGRGPGNTKTEYLILELSKKKENLINLLNLIKKYFDPLKETYKWGSNPFYYYAGLNSIHPSFVQEMLSDTRFEQDDIYENLKRLSTVGGNKFSKELIALGKNYYNRVNKGSWEPSKVVKNQNVLIIGPCESVIKYKKKIIKFIEVNKPIVFVLNAINPIPKKYVYANVVCNTLRLLADIDKYKKSNKYVVTPFSSFSKNIKSRINSKKILDFGLQVKNNRFKFDKKYAVLPNSLAVTYSLGFCSSGQCKKIFFAGLDGYNKNNPKKFEMDDILQNYKLEKDSKEIVSLTPTNYNIKKFKI